MLTWEVCFAIACLECEGAGMDVERYKSRWAGCTLLLGHGLVRPHLGSCWWSPQVFSYFIEWVFTFRSLGEFEKNQYYFRRLSKNLGGVVYENRFNQNISCYCPFKARMPNRRCYLFSSNRKPYACCITSTVNNFFGWYIICSVMKPFIKLFVKFFAADGLKEML